MATNFTRGLLTEKLKQLPRLLAATHRAASRFWLQPYPGVEDTIRQLHPKCHHVHDRRKLSWRESEQEDGLCWS